MHQKLKVLIISLSVAFLGIVGLIIGLGFLPVFDGWYDTNKDYGSQPAKECSDESTYKNCFAEILKSFDCCNDDSSCKSLATTIYDDAFKGKTDEIKSLLQTCPLIYASLFECSRGIFPDEFKNSCSEDENKCFSNVICQQDIDQFL